MSVAPISPHLAQVVCPPELKGLRGWLMWRYERHAGDAKARKIPYYAGGGRRAGVLGGSEDRERLTTFDAAIAAAARAGFTGVGFCPLPEFDITALDFDDVTGDPARFAEIESLIAEAGTYAEYSPSGNGVRAFVTGRFGNNKSHRDSGAPYTFETFSTKGFVTFTGNVLPICDLTGSRIAAPGPGLRALIESRFARAPLTPAAPAGQPLGLSEAQLAAALDALDPDMGYDDWVATGMALHHETDGDGFDLWDEWSSRGSKYAGRETTRAKWESFRRHEGALTTARTLVKMAREAGVAVGGPVASAEDFEALAPAASPGNAPRFAVIPADEFIRRPPPRWIVKGLIPEADLVVLYGESGAGKSFIALDIVLAIAQGRPWRGLATRQGRVVYIAAEGGGGFRNRLKAYTQRHQVDPASLAFGIIHAVPNFLLQDDVKAVRAAIDAAAGADLVVIDTFAQVTAGANENAAEDMGLALRHCRQVAEAAGATVILIHHAGKDASRGARGWSGIKAAADAEIEVLRGTDGRWLRTTKQKDGDDTGAWGFALETVVVDMDEDGTPIDSCVVVEAAVPEPGEAGQGKGEKARRMGPWEEAVLEAFAKLALAGDVRLPDLILRAVEMRPEQTGAVRLRRFQAKRAVKTLIKRGRLDVEGDFVFEVED